MQRCALPAVESGTFGIKNGVVGHGGTAADRFREGITRDFNKCSKNSPTSSGGEMNCTSEHICSKKSL